LVGSGLKYIPWDDELIDNMTEEEYYTYIDDEDNYGTVLWHKNGWGVPFVTGHKYKIHFGKIGTNFEWLDIKIPTVYQPEDDSIYLTHNYSAWRDAINVFRDGDQKPNNSIPEDEKFYVGG
jgi:hypothetical protein